MEDNQSLGTALHLQSVEALSTKTGIRMPGTQYASVVDGVAVINLFGPIYPRANMMTSSGATSISQFTTDFFRAWNDDDVRAIVLNIDSPGGDVRGIGDSAKLINQAVQNGRKPVLAYGNGYACSAAYYIPSAVGPGNFYASESSLVGSIGVVMTAKKNSKDEIQIVSSMSPNKRPDPETDEGMAVLKEQVDDLGAIFKKDVRKYRSVSEKDFTTNYGQGAVKIGPRALSLGMIDGLKLFGDVVEMAARAGSKKKKYVGGGGTKAEARIENGVSALLQFSEEEQFDMGLKQLQEKYNLEVEESEDALEASHIDLETSENEESNLESQVNRAELEDSLTEAAGDKAENLVLKGYILPAERLSAASVLLTAMVDDKLFGGVVPFVTAKGEMSEGTRLELIMNAYSTRPKQTLTQKAISGIKNGTTKAVILNDEPKAEADKEGVPMTAERKQELLGSSQAGQQVLANQSK